MLKEKISGLLQKSIKDLQKENKLPDFEIPEVLVEYPREKSHGDYSTNIALKISKLVKKNPGELFKQ